MNNMSSKLMDRFFRKVDGVVWDLMSGKIGVRSADGITTLEGEGDDAQIVINMFDQFGMEVPAFAQSTPVASVAVGDLIYGERKVKGWVISVNSKTVAKTTKAKTAAAPAVEAVKSFTLMTPEGNRTTWTPPKMSMLGFDSGVMVLRSLMTMLPGGQAGLQGMQSSLMPLLMMGGDNVDLGSIMPLMLMQATGSNDPNAAAGGMNNMVQMMMMMQMMKGNMGSSPSKSSGSQSFFDR